MTLFLRDLLDRAAALTYTRYVAASVVALAFDFAIFLALVHGGAIDSVWASAIGYSGGIVMHWLISSRTVFADRVATGGMDRHRQKALFVGSALAGLAATMLVVGAGDALGFAPSVAKLVAVGVSFNLTYIIRAAFVFVRA